MLVKATAPIGKFGRQVRGKTQARIVAAWQESLVVAYSGQGVSSEASVQGGTGKG